MKNEFALITGASKGIGKSMAITLAKAGYHLLLVARSEAELQQLTMQIQNDYNNQVFYLPTDLSADTGPLQVAEWAQQHTDKLSILINNAGYGLWGDFEKLELSAQMNMLALNINAVLSLTHHLLPLLKQQKQSYILNLSSTAAYQAVPTLALYAASKSFILSYSRALRYELKNTTVSVSCLCPGPTDTGFAHRAGLDAMADLAEKFNMSPESVASAGIKGMFNKKAEIIPGFLNKLSAFGAQHLNKALIERITAGLYKR
ncbi:SDR family oxidoreductase [Pedobacter hiemivivus]|uniref:SDR family oxidoreductase n=1 Tax=Pedobacter hiemivivus TaxID=2530454 RepID=A0A4V5PEM1_9SPHI|nr:SDR family oxidoreductase [Pedobacter hiemivivus]TKC65466.1 SDR family oxidoreductase [Pedobacter hiemivivus]